MNPNSGWQITDPELVARLRFQRVSNRIMLALFVIVPTLELWLFWRWAETGSIW